MDFDEMNSDDQILFSRTSGSDIGYVYCLSNPAMPGLVKIGYTNRTAVLRAEELSFGWKEESATGVPLPFEVVKDWKVPSDRSKEVEQQIHRLLHEHRVPAHGRWKAKEFFYLDPSQAVNTIEQALKQLDWWAASQANEAVFQQELTARARRRKLEAELKATLAERDQITQIEIAEKQRKWKEAAVESKRQDGEMAGLKWGAIWFLGPWFLMSALGAKDAIGWLFLAVGFFAYYMAKDGPANAYLASQEAHAELKSIEASVSSNADLQSLEITCPKCESTLILKQKPSSTGARVSCPSCGNRFNWLSFQTV